MAAVFPESPVSGVQENFGEMAQCTRAHTLDYFGTITH